MAGFEGFEGQVNAIVAPEKFEQDLDALAGGNQADDATGRALENARDDADFLAELPGLGRQFEDFRSGEGAQGGDCLLYTSRCV